MTGTRSVGCRSRDLPVSARASRQCGGPSVKRLPVSRLFEMDILRPSGFPRKHTRLGCSRHAGRCSSSYRRRVIWSSRWTSCRWSRWTTSEPSLWMHLMIKDATCRQQAWNSPDEAPLPLVHAVEWLAYALRGDPLRLENREPYRKLLAHAIAVAEQAEQRVRFDASFPLDFIASLIALFVGSPQAEALARKAYAGRVQFWGARTPIRWPAPTTWLSFSTGWASLTTRPSPCAGSPSTASHRPRDLRTVTRCSASPCWGD